MSEIIVNAVNITICKKSVLQGVSVQCYAAQSQIMLYAIL